MVGTQVQVFAETDSTNDLARRAGETGAAEGLVFFAEAQRAGRGRRGRTWSSLPGSGLLFSVLLRPAVRRNCWPRLTLVAVRATIEALSGFGVAANWKWPNDVVIGSQKIAGILVEATSSFLVLGVGMNVRQRAADFPAVLHGRAISVEMITGSGIDRVALAAAILARLDLHYRSNWEGMSFSDTLQFCVDRAAVQSSRDVRVNAGGTWTSGTLLGYTADGYLRLGLDGCEHIIVDGLLEESPA